MFTEIIVQTETADVSLTVKAVQLDRSDCGDSDPFAQPLILCINCFRTDKPGRDFHLSDEKIEEYLSARLSRREAAELERHVSKCNDCAQEFQNAKEFFTLIRGLLRQYDLDR